MVQHDSEELKQQGERKSKSDRLFYEACGDQIDYKSKVFDKYDFKEVSSSLHLFDPKYSKSN